MAIQSKRNFLGAMRVDVSMLNLIESGVASDFANLVNSVLTSGDSNIQTYVVRGFGHTGTTRSTFTVTLADSVFLSQNSERAMFVFPSDTADMTPFLNAGDDTYYLGFTVAQADTDVQQFAFKDPITNVEYNKQVPTSKTLEYLEPYFDTEGTRTDVVFIYKVTVSGSGSSVVVDGLADIATNKTEYFLSIDGTSYESLTEWATEIASIADKTVGGDLSGTYPDATVIGLQTVPLSDTAPETGQVLGYDGSEWVASDVAVKSVASSDSTITVTNTDGAVDVKLASPVAVGKGGTGLATLIAGSYMVGNNGSAVTLKTPTQVTADLDSFAGSIKGLVPASAGGTTNFLRADGSWAAPAITSYYLEAQYSSTTAISNTETSLFNWSQQEASGMQVVNGGGTNDYLDTDSTGAYLATISGRININGHAGNPTTILLRIYDTTHELKATVIVAPTSGTFSNNDSYVIAHSCIVGIGASKPLYVTAQSVPAGSSVNPTWAAEDQATPITLTLHKL